MQINEGTSIRITAKFYDENGTPVTPNGGTYRLINENGDDIIETTPFTPTGVTHTISIDSGDNMIQTPNTTRELRIVTFLFNYGINNYVGTDEIEYELMKLRGLEIIGD
jgi:hypothetical protein